MADQKIAGMISGMSPLSVLTGNELMEVSARQPDGTWKTFSIIVNKIRTNQGLSAYEVAVLNGFTGTQEEWLESLNGKSAYQVAVELGYVGTQVEWLESLKGKSAYQTWLALGNAGNEADFINSLHGTDGTDGTNGTNGTNGTDGRSAYASAVAAGYEGTELEWLTSLHGKSAYEIAVENGYTGTEEEWVNQAKDTYAPKTSLVGNLGDFSPDGMLIIACGDSTTEQFNQNNGGSQMIQTLRQPGEVWQNLLGFINFGGSGYTLKGFVEDSLGIVPTIPMTGVGAVSTWDTYGHKPTGAISQSTALAWRAGKADRVLWRICYGINDMILYAAVGNLPRAELTAYLAGYLRKAVNRIIETYPKDSILIECPNPMTARPFVAPGPGFPSISAYPTFGSDLAVDAALVEKWNQAARDAYLTIRNEYPKTVFNDSWHEVFGESRTELDATTQLPYLVNLVHPTGIADQARIRSISRITNPKLVASEGRRAEADAEGIARSMQPWEIYPSYFRENPRFKLVGNTTIVGAGSNYIDLGIPYARFLEQVNGPLYVTVADQVSQLFTTYGSGPSGANTRLTGVTPSLAMQAAVTRQTAYLYLDNINQLVAGDAYVNSIATISKEYVVCNGLSGGNGYIDFSIPRTVGRISSKYASGLRNGSIVVGGNVGTTVSLRTATNINRAGTTAQRAVRIIIPGNYTNYTAQPGAIVFSDDVPSPKVWERVVVPTAVIPLAGQGTRAYMNTDVPMLDGATFTAHVLGPPVNAILNIDIYSLVFGERNLIGTITIPANTSSSTLATGNPTSILAGAVYEVMVMSSAVSTDNVLRVTAVPV